VLPSIWDQAEMAWRVAESGVGLRVSPWHASARRMQRAIGSILENREFRRRAEEMRVALRRPGGAAKAVELIDRVVQPAAVR